MKIAMALTILSVLLFARHSFCVGKEQKLLGGWVHESGPTHFESLEFAIENSQNIFRSWLHDRPFADGSWRLEKEELIVTLDSGDAIHWTVIAIDEKQLRFRERGEEAVTVFNKSP